MRGAALAGPGTSRDLEKCSEVVRPADPIKTSFGCCACAALTWAQTDAVGGWTYICLQLANGCDVSTEVHSGLLETFIVEML